MKTLVEFINESKYFKLTDSERDDLALAIGNLTGMIGDDDEIKKFKEFKDSLSKEEIEKFEDLYNYVLDNKNDYPTINKNIIKDEIPLIKKMIEWMDNNDMLIDDYELLNILDKINIK